MIQEILHDIYVEMNKICKARLSYDESEMLIYKTISMSKFKDDIKVYDNTTNLYRPLKKEEIMELRLYGIKKYCKEIKRRSLKVKFNDERKKFQIETIRTNKDKAGMHFKRAMKALQQLKKINNN